MMYGGNGVVRTFPRQFFFIILLCIHISRCRETTNLIQIPSSFFYHYKTHLFFLIFEFFTGVYYMCTICKHLFFHLYAIFHRLERRSFSIRLFSFFVWFAWYAMTSTFVNHFRGYLFCCKGTSIVAPFKFDENNLPLRQSKWYLRKKKT